jgi:hypothetical protein
MQLHHNRWDIMAHFLTPTANLLYQAVKIVVHSSYHLRTINILPLVLKTWSKSPKFYLKYYIIWLTFFRLRATRLPDMTALASIASLVAGRKFLVKFKPTFVFSILFLFFFAQPFLFWVEASYSSSEDSSSDIVNVSRVGCL